MTDQTEIKISEIIGIRVVKILIVTNVALDVIDPSPGMWSLASTGRLLGDNHWSQPQ